MAARRLLIVMLVLLGLSTLAAALVPQHPLRGGTTASTTTTQPTTTTAGPPAGRSLSVKILVGAKKVPVGGRPALQAAQTTVRALHVGDQLSLKVFSKGRPSWRSPPSG